MIKKNSTSGYTNLYLSSAINWYGRQVPQIATVVRLQLFLTKLIYHYFVLQLINLKKNFYVSY